MRGRDRHRSRVALDLRNSRAIRACDRAGVAAVARGRVRCGDARTHAHRMTLDPPPPTSTAMSDILQDFPVAAPPTRVYDAVSLPRLIDEWWTLASTGQPTIGSAYELDFGPGYQWG